MLTIKELRQLSEKELLEELQKASRNRVKIRMDVEGGYSKGSHEAKNFKKQIAQIKTVQKEIEAEKKAESKKESTKQLTNNKA